MSPALFYLEDDLIDPITIIAISPTYGNTVTAVHHGLISASRHRRTLVANDNSNDVMVVSITMLTVSNGILSPINIAAKNSDAVANTLNATICQNSLRVDLSLKLKYFIILLFACRRCQR